jgi:hypothetical protein
MAAIIEMRTYKTKPGKRSEFLEIFTSRSMPAHREIGMKVRASGLDSGHIDSSSSGYC